MPQLDKYIFFNQIIYLTFFFSLIYIYVRGTIIPTISTILKYRKKKGNYLLVEINNHFVLLSSSKTYLDKKGKTFISFLLEKINILNTYYQKETLKQTNIVNNTIFFLIKNLTNVSNFIFKNKTELNRINFIIK